MFTHPLAGMFCFWAVGHLFGLEISKWWLAQGLFWGCFPDALSSFFVLGEKGLWGGYAHKHRDNVFHYPIPSLLLVALVTGWLKIVGLISTEYTLASWLAVLSHFFLDSFGIGWGVRWGWPFFKGHFKFFYKGKFLRTFSPEEVREEARKEGDPDWLIKIFTLRRVKDVPRIFSLIEFAAFLAFIACIPWLFFR